MIQRESNPPSGSDIGSNRIGLNVDLNVELGIDPNIDKNTPIAVLLSGGVDSSVALGLLWEKGFRNLHAFYLKIWLEEELHSLGECPWQEDTDFAAAVCQQFNVPFDILPFQQEYYDQVVEYAIRELREGRTPSPDLFCNQMIKFGAFFQKISDSFRYIATGHYAQIRKVSEEDPGRVHLYRGVDPIKDQTYFLSQLSQSQLQRVLFPLGGLSKKRVRELASLLQLPNQKRKDSQGICFLGKINYPDFIRHYLGESLGEIIDEESGAVLGEHKGFWFHTIGQRQGLGLGGGPWYVTHKERESNRIYVSRKSSEIRGIDKFYAIHSNWIQDTPPLSVSSLDVKVRHGERLHGCQITQERENRFEVTISPPDGGIASGQFVVYYDGEECLGGSQIELINRSFS